MADSAKVGGLEIEITASAGNAVTALDRLASTLERLDGQSGKSGQSLEALSAKLKNLANAPGFSNLVGDVERIQAAGTSAAAGVEKLSAATAKASKGTNMAKLENELARVEAQAERDGNSLLRLQEQLDNMKLFEGKGTPGTQAEWAGKIREVEAELDKLSATIDALDVKRRSLQQAISTGTTAQPVAKMSETLKTVAVNCEGVSSAAKRVDSSLKGAAKGAKGLGDAVEEAGNKGESGFSKLLSTLGKMSLRMLALRAIRGILSSITEGIREAASQNASVNETLSKIASSVEFLRDSIVAAILPAIEAIEPILTFLLDTLANIFNFVAKIIGFLTGQKSVVQAKKQFKDFAGSLNETASAAKDALKYLIGIDELTIINDDNGGGGGGNVTPGGLHFEDSNIDLPDWSGGILPSPIWSPDPVPAPQFATVTVPEYAGELIPSPAWSPALIPAPVFLPVEVPELVGAYLPSPAWQPSHIPAPGFQPVELPGWALVPLPVPQWEQDPVRAPVLDTLPLQAGLETLKAGFSAAWSTITAATAAAASQVQVKLETMQSKLSSSAATAKQTVSQFLENAKANLTAWAGSMQTNFRQVSEYIKVNIFPALDTAKSAFLTFFKTTAGFMSSWGMNLGTNLKTTLTYIPAAVSAGLTAAAASVSTWVNGTASNVKSWGENLIRNGATAISGFVKYFISGLASAWEAFKNFLSATGEKISSWWSANKSWAAPVAVAGLATLAVGAVVLTGGVSLPTIAMAAPAFALANGGVITKPTTALIGEYPGAQSDPEIVSPQHILRETFRQELNGGVSNEDVISVIFAAAQQIVRAINDKDTSVMMDGRNVTSRVTDMQNRNNRMYGKTIQNI